MHELDGQAVSLYPTAITTAKSMTDRHRAKEALVSQSHGPSQNF